LQNTQTGLGAFDVAHGAKTELIEYESKSSKSINNLKYVKVAKDITRGVAYVQGALIVADVYKNSQIKASNIMEGAITGLSTIPGWGWAIGGAYFLSDLITKEVTRKTIGERLDNAVGGALVEW